MCTDSEVWNQAKETDHTNGWICCQMYNKIRQVFTISVKFINLYFLQAYDIVEYCLLFRFIEN